MDMIIMSLGSMPAEEGLGGVLSSALLALGTLALIYGVLVMLDRYHKKHSNDEKTEEHIRNDNAGMSFPQVLDEQIRKKEDNDKLI